MRGKSTWRVISIGAMQLAAAIAIFLLPAAAWAQKESEEPGSELGLRFTPGLEQKLEARSMPAKLTAEDESVLAGKGYVKIGTIRDWQLIGKSSEGMAKALQDEILKGAASYGGDVVRLYKDGVLQPYYVGKGKMKGTCIQWQTNSSDTYETTMGVTTKTTRTTRTCTQWDTRTLPTKSKKLDSLISEGTVWRYDPKLAAINAKRSADLAAIEPLLRDHPYWDDAERYGTPLHAATVFGDKDAAELLLAHGANINALDGDFLTPLHVAAKSGNKDMVEWLLAHGADVNAVNKYEMTPLGKARNKDIAELLLAHGADIHAREKERTTPLDWAASDGNKELVECLLAHGADINASDEVGETPLHKAAESGSKDVAEVLLAHGADINAKNDHGDTPLGLAAREEHKDMVDFLRQHGGHK